MWLFLCSPPPSCVSLAHSTHVDNMKMKPAKKKSPRNKARRGEKQEDVDTVKTEPESEEASRDVCIDTDGLNIQIKEEPDSQDFSEEHNEDTKPDTLASRSGVHIKEESDSDHKPEYEFTEAAVKEEPESWIKEERDSEEEAEEEVCIGKRQEIMQHRLGCYLCVTFGCINTTQAVKSTCMSVVASVYISFVELHFVFPRTVPLNFFIPYSALHVSPF